MHVHASSLVARPSAVGAGGDLFAVLFPDAKYTRQHPRVDDVAMRLALPEAAKQEYARKVLAAGLSGVATDSMQLL